MEIGYIRVSKSDGSQTVDLQQDALIAAGIDAARIYKDLASGRKDEWPRIKRLSQSAATAQHSGDMET